MPAVAGSVAPDFERVRDAFAKGQLQDRGGTPLCVYRDGERVVDLWTGCDVVNGRAYTAETLTRADVWHQGHGRGLRPVASRARRARCRGTRRFVAEHMYSDPDRAAEVLAGNGVGNAARRPIRVGWVGAMLSVRSQTLERPRSKGPSLKE